MKKKKIGCVIAYGKGHNNYGTSLQAYAMLKKIQELGYDVEVINYQKQLSINEKIAYVINALRVGEVKEIHNRIFADRMKNTHQQYAKGLKLRTSAVDAYKEKKLLPLFHTYIGYNSLCEGSKEYDVVVVGSDQVWTPLSLPNKFFNLLFVDDFVRKVAYASSFGVSDIPKFQQKRTGMFLDRFSQIGVRELRAKEIVDSLSKQTAQVVADPTLLLTREEWEKELLDDISPSTLVNKKRAELGGYIFCYFLGTNTDARKAALELKNKTGLKIITIRHMDEFVENDENFGDEAPYNVDPNDFVRYIAHAEYVCTDSFHCTVFSIIFHRQFMTFYRFSNKDKTNRNSRINSLFDILGIPSEHIYSGKMNDIKRDINWNNVDKKIIQLRSQSVSFLQEALQL